MKIHYFLTVICGLEDPEERQMVTAKARFINNQMLKSVEKYNVNDILLQP